MIGLGDLDGFQVLEVQLPQHAPANDHKGFLTAHRATGAEPGRFHAPFIHKLGRPERPPRDGLHRWCLRV